MGNNYEYLLFDLDNTLVDDNENRKYAISRVLDYLEYEYDDEILNTFVDKDNEYWKKMDKGEFNDKRPPGMTKEETFIWAGGNRMNYFFEELSFQECVKLNNLYMEYMKERIFPIKDTKKILEEIKKLGYKLYIITNGPKKAAYMKQNAISDNFFIDLIASEEVGYMKPHQEFYDAMYEKFNITDKSKMLIIGDELDKDILGGNNQEIDTVWFNRFYKSNETDIKPTYEINEILELKKILKR